METEKIIYDDYNSTVCEDQSVTPVLTTNCGSFALRNGVKVIEINDISDVKKFIDPKYHNFVYEVCGSYWLIMLRKLMPIECWRLMGFSDDDFHKAEKAVSNTQLYKQAGNSIVVSVLEAIFSQLNIAGVKPWNEMTEKEKYELIYRNHFDEK